MSRISNERHRLIRSRQSQGLYDNSIRDQLSREHSEYQQLAQFQLRRQKEKIKILEQRLHNKEVFIQQMKQYQEELTAAFEKCQQQLAIANKQIQNLTTNERQHLEEMAQLKHLIIRLEEQVNIRDEELKRKQFNSVHKAEQKISVKRETRSKTMMNEEENTPIILQKEVQNQTTHESKKITKFLNHFLMMAECFCPEAKEGTLTNRLKASWKWIKSVVKQWNELLRDRQTVDDFIKKIKLYAKIPPNTKKYEVLKMIINIINNQ